MKAEMSKAELRRIADAACRQAPIKVIPTGHSNRLSGKDWMGVVQSPTKVDLEEQALMRQLAELQEQEKLLERAARRVRENA